MLTTSRKASSSKTLKYGLGILSLAVPMLLASSAMAQDPHFDSGSDGSDGVLSAAANETITINMDDHSDGVFNYVSVNIESGATVLVESNEDNTPLVILVQEDVFWNGRLDMTGEAASGVQPGLGGPGGWSGGAAGRVSGGTFPPGAGAGPGGGEAVFGDSPAGTGRGLNEYMKPSLFPQIGGSGGGGGEGTSDAGGAGGGGGGAVTFAVSGTFELGGNGSIDVAGGRGGNSIGGTNIAGSGGSGGSVRIIATAIDGGFEIDALGGTVGSFGPSIADRTGDMGIIRLETFDMVGTFSNLRGRVYRSLPGLLNTDGTGLGTVRISSVGSASVPLDAGSNTALPDVIIPAGITNPVEIEVTAENVTLGQSALIRVNYEGEGGQVIEGMTGPLAGTEALSTATASINLNAGNGTMVAVLSTPITRGSVPSAIAGADGKGQVMIGGEVATLVEKETTPGSDTVLVRYITDSGKQAVYELKE